MTHTIVLEVENFGPIKQGKITIEDLALFIGMPNTGKSYISKLLYSLAISLREVVRMRRLERSEDFYQIMHPIIEDMEIPSTQPENEIMHYTLLDKNVKLQEIKHVINYFLELGIKKAVTSTFRSYGKTLLRNSWIRLTTPKISFQIHEGKVKILNVDADVVTKLKVELVGPPSGTIAFLEYSCEGLTCARGIPYRIITNKEFMRNQVVQAVTMLIAYNTTRYLFNTAHAIYIPYGRTQLINLLLHLRGIPIMRATKTLKRVEDAWIQPIKDYLDLVDLSITEQGNIIKILSNYNKLFAKIVYEIVQGEIVVTKRDGITDVRYKPYGTNLYLNLYNASAMVNEVASIILPMLRFIDYRQPLIFLEEPESQLHPQAQRYLAWALALLTTGGTRLIITTHSDYMITEIAIINALRKMDQNEIQNINDILKQMLPFLTTKEIADILSNLSSIKINAYHFKDGEIESVSSDKLLMEIPSMTINVDKQLNVIKELLVKKLKSE